MEKLNVQSLRVSPLLSHLLNQLLNPLRSQLQGPLLSLRRNQLFDLQASLQQHQRLLRGYLVVNRLDSPPGSLQLLQRHPQDSP